jgi:hypothetical protein
MKPLMTSYRRQFENCDLGIVEPDGCRIREANGSPTHASRIEKKPTDAVRLT